ncbi:hypothetical protein P886_4774 [Alteromonadaceae bacterium 2753L.S.0a.02]|nr:hypothetical protein P886_4774 [Alteromonadaceae bacterium 2753L.S.0a.02]
MGALTDSAESLTILVFLVALFSGLAYFFKEQVIAAVFFIVLALVCIYALINEIIGMLPSKEGE